MSFPLVGNPSCLSFRLVRNPSEERFWSSQNDINPLGIGHNITGFNKLIEGKKISVSKAKSTKLVRKLMEDFAIDAKGDPFTSFFLFHRLSQGFFNFWLSSNP
jgi:hypothetical protein